MYDGGILAYKLLPGKDVNHGIHGGLEEDDDEDDEEDESIGTLIWPIIYLITTTERFNYYILQ